MNSIRIFLWSIIQCTRPHSYIVSVSNWMSGSLSKNSPTFQVFCFQKDVKYCRWSRLIQATSLSLSPSIYILKQRENGIHTSPFLRQTYPKTIIYITSRKERPHTNINFHHFPLPFWLFSSLRFFTTKKNKKPNPNLLK